MKRLLLGSTAIASVAALALPAHAEMEMGIGGYYVGAAGLLLTQDDGAGESGDNTQSDAFRQDVEVHFNADVTLDNGLSIGARIQLEGMQSSDQIDEVYAFFEGEGWGQIRFGDTPEALAQMCYLVPVAGNVFGVDSPYFDFGNAGQNGFANTNSSCLGLDDNSTKIVYFSPTFGGFSFAASWTPDRRGEDQYSGVANSNGPGGTSFNNNSGQVDDNISAAVSFSHDFEDVSLVIGGAVSHANWEAPAANQDKDTMNYNAYFQVSFGGFLIGASGEYIDNWNSSSPSEQDLWMAGAAIVYSWDAWSVGLGYSHGTYEMTDNSDHDTLDIVQIQASYALAEGISIDGMLGYTAYNDDNEDNPGGNGDYDAVETGVGFYIEF